MKVVFDIGDVLLVTEELRHCVPYLVQCKNTGKYEVAIRLNDEVLFFDEQGFPTLSWDNIGFLLEHYNVIRQLEAGDKITVYI